MTNSYGCIAYYDDILNYNLKNSKLEKHINKIVNEMPTPNINFKKEVNKVQKVMSKYSRNNQVKISNHYDEIDNLFYKICKKRINKSKVVYYGNVVNKLVTKLKIKYNVQRPFQASYKINKCINPIALPTTHTPSLPSGHTALFYFLYIYFSKIDPENKSKYKRLYEKGALSRIIGGNHFFIDNEYSIMAIDRLVSFMDL